MPAATTTPSRAEAKSQAESGGLNDLPVGQSEAELDAALDSIERDHGWSPEGAPASAAGKKGGWEWEDEVDLSFLKPEDRPAPEQSGGEENTASPAHQPEPTATPKGAEKQGTDDEFESALQACRKDGWSREMLDKHSREEILGYGTAASQRQADVQTKLDERARRIEGEQTRNGNAEAAGTQPAQPSSVPTAEAKAFQESIADITGDEDVGVAASAALNSAVEARTAHLQQGYDGLQELVSGMLVQTMKGELRGRYPSVTRPDVWKKVEEKATRYTSTGAYHGLQGLNDAFDEACRVVIGSPQTAAQRAV